MYLVLTEAANFSTGKSKWLTPYFSKSIEVIGVHLAQSPDSIVYSFPDMKRVDITAEFKVAKAKAEKNGR
jgi:hypothetical protein